MLETGNALLASNVAGEWVFWKTGKVDFIDQTVAAGSMIMSLLAGWAVILIGAIWMFIRAYKRRKVAA